MAMQGSVPGLLRYLRDHRNVTLGLIREQIKRAVLRDEQVFLIADPAELMEESFIPSHADSTGQRATRSAGSELPGRSEKKAKDNSTSSTLLASQRKKIGTMQKNTLIGKVPQSSK